MHGARTFKRKHDLVVVGEKLDVLIDLGTPVMQEERILHRQLFERNGVSKGIIIIVRYNVHARRLNRQVTVFSVKIVVIVELAGAHRCVLPRGRKQRGGTRWILRERKVLYISAI